MLALALDRVWSVLGIGRARSMRRRLRAADRRIASLVDAGRARSQDHFELEPWRYSVPATVLVDLAAARGFVPDGAGGEWELRERVRFVPGGLGAGRIPTAASAQPAPATERSAG